MQTGLIFIVLATGLFLSSAENTGLESLLRDKNVQKQQVSKDHLIATGFHKDLTRQFTVNIVKNRLEGSWITYYSRQTICDSGRFDQSLPDGTWKSWYPNGQIRSIRNYHAEKFRYALADLNRANPKFQSFIITRYSLEGMDVRPFFSPDFEEHPDMSQDSSLLAKIRYNTAPADVDDYIAPYLQCFHHGLSVSYFEDGKVKDSGNYVNGLKNGFWKEYTMEDQVAIGMYRHGIKAQQWKYYDTSGKLEQTETYSSDGKLKNRFVFRN